MNPLERYEIKNPKRNYLKIIAPVFNISENNFGGKENNENL